MQFSSNLLGTSILPLFALKGRVPSMTGWNWVAKKIMFQTHGIKTNSQFNLDLKLDKRHKTTTVQALSISREKRPKKLLSNVWDTIKYAKILDVEVFNAEWSHPPKQA